MRATLSLLTCGQAQHVSCDSGQLKVVNSVREVVNSVREVVNSVKEVVESVREEGVLSVLPSVARAPRACMPHCCSGMQASSSFLQCSRRGCIAGRRPGGHTSCRLVRKQPAVLCAMFRPTVRRNAPTGVTGQSTRRGTLAVPWVSTNHNTEQLLHSRICKPNTQTHATSTAPWLLLTCSASRCRPMPRPGNDGLCQLTHHAVRLALAACNPCSHRAHRTATRPTKQQHASLNSSTP